MSKKPNKQKEPIVPMALTILNDLVRDHPLEPDMSPSTIVKKYWGLYTSPRSRYKRNRSLDGAFFRELIILILEKYEIFPIYVEAKVAFIRPHTYDLIFYESDKGPIVWSLKVSLRERWKQADGEGYIVQTIHRNAASYCITLNHSEVKNRRKYMSDHMGIDAYILADTDELDKAIIFLKNSQLVSSPVIQAVSSKRVITECRSSLLTPTLTENPQVTMVLP